MASSEPAGGPVVRRHPANPILSARDVPYRATLVFNPGVARFGGRCVMVFRNDYGDAERKRLEGTNLGLATSGDGLAWTVAERPVFEMKTEEIARAYDPRLTVVDGRLYLCFAADTRHGIRGGVAVTDDLERFEVLSLSAPDNRNMVLFPERRAGRLARLERPFPVYGRGAREAFDIWYSESPDGLHWGRTELVLGSERVPFCNRKIGPAAPPVRTERGWLALFHAVDVEPGREFASWHGGWVKRYTVGAMLLDPDEPWRVTAFTREPVMVPEAAYEREGYRGGVVFPGGLLAEPAGEMKIYYGAADTVVALAFARVEGLLDRCEPV